MHPTHLKKTNLKNHLRATPKTPGLVRTLFQEPLMEYHDVSRSQRLKNGSSKNTRIPRKANFVPTRSIGFQNMCDLVGFTSVLRPWAFKDPSRFHNRKLCFSETIQIEECVGPIQHILQKVGPLPFPKT